MTSAQASAIWTTPKLRCKRRAVCPPTAVGGHTARRLQRSLGVVQIALACALVIAGGLLGVSLWRVLSQSVGFVPQQRMVATIVLPKNVKNTAAWATLKPQLLQLPGVSAAGATDMLPFSGNHVQGDVHKIGANESSASLIVQLPSISADFFSASGIKFLAGRAFTSSEVANEERRVGKKRRTRSVAATCEANQV